MGALSDEIPLELSQCSEEMEDQLATTGRRVDLLLQGPEANAAFLEVTDGVDQMRQRATEPVETPDNEGVPLTEVSQCICKPWAVCTGTRCRVGENPLTACSGECVLLEREGLVKG